jgi:CRP-like cAMP-binding protein
MIDVKALKKLELFEELSAKQLDELIKTMEFKKFKAHDHVYERGDDAVRLYVVHSGLVSMRRVEPGEEAGISFEMRGPGELFGAASFMEPREYTLTAVCLEDTDVFAIDSDKLLELFGEEPWLGYKMVLKVAQIYFDRYKSAKRQLYGAVKEPTVISALPG